jgi:hypothetical protein
MAGAIRRSEVMEPSLKHGLDAVAIGTVVATIAGWLPAVAAALSIIWTLIRIFETKTVQRLLGRQK